MELANIYAQIRAGIWEPPRPRQAEDQSEPAFHEYASLWLRRRVAEGIAENTRKDYLWQLSSHLLPFFGAYRLSDITPQLVEAFKEHKLDERARVTAAAEFGEPLRDRDGRPRRPLSNTSVNKFLVLLSAILEAAVRRECTADNPAARVERLRIRRPKGAILEADELESLIEAARLPIDGRHTRLNGDAASVNSAITTVCPGVRSPSSWRSRHRLPCISTGSRRAAARKEQTAAAHSSRRWAAADCGQPRRRISTSATWLRLRRIVELPALPLGVVVVDARRRGDAVDLRLTVPSVRRNLSQRAQASAP